jgi:O-methyltransferase
MNTTVPVSKRAPKPKFNSRLPFSADLPYERLFAERLPLIHAFSLAVHHAALAQREKSLVDKMRAWFARDDFAFHAAECGVYMGNSLVACTQMVRASGLKMQFHALDTFSGLPELSEADLRLAPVDAKYRDQKLFADTSFEAVKARVAEAGMSDAVVFHQGLFADTLPNLPEVKYHFVNIDCDLFNPHIECLEYFYPRMAPGGVIFFDDYGSREFPMARAAVDQFMGGKPEILFHLCAGDDGPNRTKTYIVKY